MAFWDKQAKQWAHLGPPLKPSSTDIQMVSAWINEVVHLNNKPLSVLLLGVTPEIATIPWPKYTKLFAIDNNLSMLRSVLPMMTPTIKPMGLAGNWLQLPVSADSIDLVIGDGCFTLLAKKDYATVTKEIWRVLNPKGSFVMRFFTRPSHNESLEVIEKDLLLGRIPSFHVLKLRIVMALHGTIDQGVCLKKVWSIWNTRFKNNHHSLMQELQWSKDTMDTIDSFKNTKVTHTFPTLQELRQTLHAYFNEQEIFVPNYPLGDRCPSLRCTPINKEMIDDYDDLPSKTANRLCYEL